MLFINKNDIFYKNRQSINFLNNSYTLKMEYPHNNRIFLKDFKSKIAQGAQILVVFHTNIHKQTMNIE